MNAQSMIALNQWLRKQAKADFNLSLTDQQLDQFTRYYHELITVNRQVNLTSITEPAEVYGKHFYDSLTLAKVVSFERIQTVIDVGTGAGFPAVPLKIVYPHLEVVLLDSLKKRVVFLEKLIKKLELKGITCVHGRAEDLAHQNDYRQRFDLAVARAVAKLNILAEYCLPFVRVNGMFVAMKGMDVGEEIALARSAFQKLGRATYQHYPFSLPNEWGQRTMIRVKKRSDTPHAYPRRAGIPKRQPL